MARNELHVVMVPWSAFGHLMPFLQLSISLAKEGVHVSFISTPNNIKRLPKIPPNVSPLIDLIELPMPELDRNLLPEGAEATVDIPFEKIQYLKVAHDLLQQPFNRFIENQRPDWIIIDVLNHWAVQIAEDHRVPLLLFSAYSAAFLSFIGPPEYLVGDGVKSAWPSPDSMTSVPEWFDFPSTIAYRKYEANGFYNAFFGGNKSGIADAERYAKILVSCKAVAIRSCEEFESEYLNLKAKNLKKTVIPVGLIPPEKAKERAFFDESWTRIFKWLDEQRKRSVVFVGFGSECKLSKDHVYEIAYGLEASELPFVWALRKPDWATDHLDVLPTGFSHRTSGKGAVHIGWAPQMEILGHQSIGGSLFHSGWGSVIEALQFGHTLIVLPLIVDQGLNARLMVEKGLAIEVERREEDGSFDRDDIAKALRHAMVSEEGEGLRTNARKAAAIFGDQRLQEHYTKRFVEYLKTGVAK